MTLILPKIYPITDTRLSKLSHAAQVARLIEGGAAFIQLREKFAAPREFYEAAREALEIARPRGVKIIINDRVDIALALQADGVHLGQNDLPPEHARKILGAQAIIGYSTHNVRQAAAALELPIDYLAIGPVYNTLTKENADAAVGVGGVRDVRVAVGDFPLVAIGGITAENFGEILTNGADSVAIISDLLADAEQIVSKMSRLLSRSAKLK